MDIVAIEPPSAREYVNRHFLAPKHPFRMLLCGPSGSGKTNVMVNLIMKYLHYDRVYIYAKNYNDDEKWMFVKAFFEKVANDMYRKYVKKCMRKGESAARRPDGAEATVDDFMMAEFHSNVDEIVGVDSLDSDKQNLVVFDDFVNEKSIAPMIVDYFTRGRHANCSVCYLSQSYFSTPKDVRLNCNYFALFRVSSRREIMRIRDDHCADISPDVFMKMFGEIGAHDFLLIDKRASDLCLRYRKNFDECFAREH